MKLMTKKNVLSLVLVLCLGAMTSCSSKSEQESGDDSAMSAENFALELNGTSDGNTAGGLRTVFFDYESSDLSEDAKSALENNAKWLNVASSVDIQIEGHCDERGGHQFNLALGERRARSVRDYLIALGVSESRISIVSYGKEKPLAFGHDDSSWSQNRRANFMVTAK
ncbi:MAG: peptidoglycan-associated lipoprotein Pal [Bacteriovoracaceae bacterium]|jgi:peptidoglycan-associated lipoprotein|nr:peptidoglycan-associated lipoprotein Pal [Bacteriovoracaceae bacterium]